MIKKELPYLYLLLLAFLKCSVLTHGRLNGFPELLKLFYMEHTMGGVRSNACNTLGWNETAALYFN